MVKRGRQLLDRIGRFLRAALHYAFWCSSVLFVVLTLAMLGLSSVEMSLETGAPPPKYMQVIADLALKGWGVHSDVITDRQNFSTEYRQNVSILLTTINFCIGLGLLFLPTVALLKYRDDLRKAAVVDVLPVSERGRDDIRQMSNNFFTGAERIWIFSGDFDWLPKSPDFLNQVKTLADAGKILLISYKSENEVEKNWPSNQSGTLGKLREHFRFWRSGPKVKFTVIQRSGFQHSFMSLVPNGAGPGCDANILVHSHRGEAARALLYLVRQLGQVDDVKDRLEPWNESQPDHP